MALKILLIDDNEELLDLMQEILTQNSYETEKLYYTSDIIQTLEKSNPDLLILDYLLTGINGGELCSQVKKNPATQHLPVMIVSAYPRVLESLGNYGQDAFLAKPFGIDEFLDTVSYCLFKTIKTDH
jgi:CheY-like chemotaxis protein